MDGVESRADRGSPHYRRALIALFCAGVATFAQMYSPQGLLPEISRDFGVSVSASSWAIGATTIGVACATLPWARVSDRFGRLLTMRVTVVLAMLVAFGVIFSPNFGSLVALRALEGVFLAGLPALAVTALTEIVHPRALGTAVGTYIAGITLGGLVGRLAANAAAEVWGWRGGMASVTIAAAVATACFLLLAPRASTVRQPGGPILASLAANLRNTGVLVLVAQAFLLMGSFVAVYNYLAFRLESPPFNLSLLEVSWLFLAYLAGVFSSRWVWRLTQRWSTTAVAIGSLTVMLLGLLLTLTPWLLSIIVGLVLFTGGFFGAHSIASGLIGPRAAGRAGASQAPALYNLGFYAGSSLLGALGGVWFALGGWSALAGFVASAIMTSALLVWWYRRRERAA